jgi:hypothetical protein
MTRQLVVVTGPIASGKTTVARGVAAEARRQGRTAAAVDMDDHAQMLIGDDWLVVTPDDWLIARELASGISETLFLHEVETVIISGPFFTEDSREHLLRGFAIEPPTLFVLLRVSLTESMRRAKNDSLRLLTGEPAFVERIFATIDWERLPAQHVDIETDGLALSEVIKVVAEQVLG